MAKVKKAALNEVSKSQSQRLLDAVRAKKAGGSGPDFSQIGKTALRRTGRKAAKGGVGGGAEGA